MDYKPRATVDDNRASEVNRFIVAGRSMLPAFVPGERLAVEALSYRLRRPRPGEVAVVRQAGGNGRLDLKRIAAGPGETASVRGEPIVCAPVDAYRCFQHTDIDALVLGNHLLLKSRQSARDERSEHLAQFHLD